LKSWFDHSHALLRCRLVYVTPNGKSEVPSGNESRLLHHNNSSGTFDSICLICSQTAACMPTESELRKEQGLHLLDVRTLEDHEFENRLWYRALMLGNNQPDLIELLDPL
jgi:hypothetical protein